MKAPTPTPSTSATLSAASTDAIRPPTTTAAQLTSVTITIAPEATNGSANSVTCRPPASGKLTDMDCSAPPLAMLRKIANPNASPASPPVVATKKRVQP